MTPGSSTGPWSHGYFYVDTGAIGFMPYHKSANTFLKNGSCPLSSDSSFCKAGTDMTCEPYVGWNLPADQVKQQCDGDSNCDGFIMQASNAGGQLCKFDHRDSGPYTYFSLDA
jgi:hypothetical protein